MPAAFAALRFPLDEIEVFHTDRGGEFTGERIERMLDVFGTTRSLSRPGNPYDNAVVESTNRLVKKELIHRNVYTNVEQLRSDVNRYVVVVQPPTAPLDPRVPEPRGVHTTRKNPLETVQHTVANPMDQPVAVEDAVRVCRRLPLGDQSVEDAVDLGRSSPDRECMRVTMSR